MCASDRFVRCGAFVLLLSLGLCAAIAGGETSSGALTVQTRPVSPSVLATILTRNQEIKLVVLWRGAPLWFGSGSHRGSSGGSSGKGLFRTTVSYGNASLSLSCDEQHQSADIQGLAISLAAGQNLIMVDSADAAGAPKSVQTDVLSGLFDSSNSSLGHLLTSSSNAIAFLRCDVASQNGTANKALSRIVCDDLAAK